MEKIPAGVPLPKNNYMTSKRKKILLEICAASLEDCLAAQEGGADRVELNSALRLGGLTPSLGLLQEVRQALHIPIIVMIRPRPAGFCYSAGEFTVMQRDIESALAHGADGIAFGILHQDGTIDQSRCARVIQQAAGREIVFHRAFDVTPDATVALEQLIDLGVTRVLTSGQESSAYNGAAKIAELIRQAAGRIQILPAGGINRFTMADILARTGCEQVHASLTMPRSDASTRGRPQIKFGNAEFSGEEQYYVTDRVAVEELRQLLSR